MTRRIAPLTPETLPDLAPACRSCLFWELDPVRRRRLDPELACSHKVEWVGRVLREWGPCGQVVYVDGTAVGHLAYAPAAFVPGAGGFPTAPVSEDAVLLTTAHVAPEHAGAGLGKVLVQAMVRDLIERNDATAGVRAVEAFADTRDLQGCVISLDFLTRVGFTIHRAHATYPRLRLDLASVVTWREQLGAAVSRLGGAVRPARAFPEPAPREPGGLSR